MLSSPLASKAAQSLERFLGDPRNPENIFSFKRSVALDELEQFPEEACTKLDQWGIPGFYVPQSYGGRIRDYGELIALLRVLARRDLTLAIGHCKTYLGSAAVWVGGSEEQKQALSCLVRRCEPVSLGLTERAHGADLLASEVLSVSADEGFRLSGEKWLVNNATRCSTMTVFARTDARGGPRGFSLFLVEKRKLTPSSYSHLAKIKTLGIRGADISGMVLEDAWVAEDALVGEQGAGLEIILKTLQLTRTLVPALSLGAGDSALRVALDFASSRVVHGARVFDIPYAQNQIVYSFLDLMICELLMLAGGRAFHVTPSHMSVWSAVVKYFVPMKVDACLQRLSLVLGARHYLREEPDAGIFQKILRDHRLVSVFDGSSTVNLNLIAQQLRHLSETRRRSPESSASLLRALFSLRAPLPDFDPSMLKLSCRGQDPVLGGLSACLANLDDRRRGVNSALLERLQAAIHHLDRDVDQLVSSCGADWHKSAQVFQLSKRYCHIFVASVCVHLWVHNASAAQHYFQNGEWLSLVVEHLLDDSEHSRALNLGASQAQAKAQIAADLLSRLRNDDAFPCPLDMG